MGNMSRDDDNDGLALSVSDMTYGTQYLGIR